MPNRITLVTFGNCYGKLITLLLALLVKDDVLHWLSWMQLNNVEKGNKVRPIIYGLITKVIRLLRQGWYFLLQNKGDLI